jgi:hypothetical protein
MNYNSKANLGLYRQRIADYRGRMNQILLLFLFSIFYCYFQRMSSVFPIFKWRNKVRVLTHNGYSHRAWHDLAL